MLYIIILYFGNLKRQYHKKNILWDFNGPNQAHWQAFIYLSCIVTYMVIIYILTVVMFFLFVSFLFVYLHCVHYLIISALVLSLAFVPYYCKFIQSCWFFFLFLCISIVSWTVIHCEENNFQSNLNPKEIYFIFSSSFLAFFFILHLLKYPLYVAFNSNVTAGMFFSFVSAWRSVQCVCESHTNQNGTERMYMGELFVFGLVVLFICHVIVIFFLFLFWQKGVECAIPHTAIYAGQELWHFIFCLWDL